MDQRVVLKPEEFGPENIEHLCREFLMQQGPDRGLRRLLPAMDQSTIEYALSHGAPHITERQLEHAASDLDGRDAAYDQAVAMIKWQNLSLANRSSDCFGGRRDTDHS